MVKKFRRKSFSRYKIGGSPPVNTKFAQPKVNATTSSGALEGVQNDQAAQNDDLVKMNTEMAGGRRRQRGGADEDVTVPQFNQTGEEGNDTITGTVDSTLTGNEQGRYDADVAKPAPDSGMPKGGARRRTRRRKRRKTRRRKSRRKSKKRRKSRRRKRKRSRR